MKAITVCAVAVALGMNLLNDCEKILYERVGEIQQHRELLHKLSDLKTKVRQQTEKVDLQWQMLCDIDRKECEFLKAEQELVGNQLRNESISASKEQLAVTKAEAKESPLHWKSKYLPSRAGNYLLIARRLQTEIRNFEQIIIDMKSRLQMEIQQKNDLEAKVRMIRHSLAMNKKCEPHTSLNTPVF